MTKPSKSERALEMIRRSPGLTVEQIAKRLDTSHNTMSSVLTTLYRKGIVDRYGSDIWPGWCYVIMPKKKNQQ